MTLKNRRLRIVLIAAGSALLVYLVVGLILAGVNESPVPPDTAPIIL